MSHRLVIVSHRAPVRRGGDVAGLPPMADIALADSNTATPTLWFGWSGRLSQDPTSVVSIRRQGALTCVGVDLSTSQYEGHLTGFSHSTLWPVFHEMPVRMRFHADDLALYRAVNGMFAARLAPLLRGGDKIWIHDYPLLPLGWMLRQCGMEAPLGFYLHIPFPAAETLWALPWRRKLAEDLAAYDFIGFQSRRDLENFHAFMRCARLNLPVRGTDSRLYREPAAEVLPVGIATRTTMAAAGSAEAQEQAARFARCLTGRTMIIGADRLDYTKGLLERLHGYERLLAANRDLHGKIGFIQITTPSRSLVPGYLELREAQKGLGQQINDRFGTQGWMPFYDIYGALAPSSLAALYRNARAGLFTPLRDGASLMAKEYVAAQNPADPGMLVLSRQSGAADHLAEAVLVDPSDPADIAKGVREALRMPLGERQERWRRMIVKLLHHDAAQWHHGFVDALGRAQRLNKAIGDAAVEPACAALGISMQPRTGALAATTVSAPCPETAS